jgi:hypothetical protein
VIWSTGRIVRPLPALLTPVLRVTAGPVSRM